MRWYCGKDTGWVKEPNLNKLSLPTSRVLSFPQGLRQHLLHYKLPNSSLPEGFELYSQLPRLRQQYLQTLPAEVLQNGGFKT